MTYRLSNFMNHGRAVGLGLLAAAAFAASPAAAADYPEKDITMIIPFGAGGGSDTLARTIASVIEEMKLVPVTILPENRTGGSAAVGYSAVAKEKGNPYYLATVSVSCIDGGQHWMRHATRAVAGLIESRLRSPAS